MARSSFVVVVLFAVACGLAVAVDYDPVKQDPVELTHEVVMDRVSREFRVRRLNGNDRVAPTEQSCVRAGFEDKIELVGWSFLLVTDSNGCSDADKAYATGLIEANLTWSRMYQTCQNANCNQVLHPKLQAYVDDNDAWVSSQIAANPSDPFWHHVSLLNQQLDGLADGFNRSCSPDKALSKSAIRLMSLGGDLETLAGLLGLDEQRYWFGFGRGHCSALIKVLPNNEDIYVSHDTWSSFNSMLRVWKRYELNYHMTSDESAPLVPAVNISFSGYPGSLYSGDDFYMMSSGVVSVETTIGNSNPELFDKYITPQSVLEWQRNMVANRVAASAADWCHTFSRYNSGTYNNEWLVVSYANFKPGQPLPAGTFWLLDQIPGDIEAQDMSSFIDNQRYMPSYNVPYFQRIYNESGWPALYEKLGDWFSYDNTARANIFRRDQGKVTNMTGMQRLMRYNDFQHDPLSECDCTPHPYSSENTIACRDDLNDPNGTYPFSSLGFRNHAATDTKITSFGLFTNNLQAMAISGPTYDQQPVFSWATTPFRDHVPHYGHPIEWKFPWVLVQRDQ